MSAPEIDRTALLDFLSRLDAISFSRVALLIPGATAVDSPFLPVGMRALSLVAFVEGSAGSGLSAIATAVGICFPEQFARFLGKIIDNDRLRAFLSTPGVTTPDRQKSLERIVNAAHMFYNPVSWAQHLSVAIRRVCRISIPLSTGGTAYGTGFLVGPDAVLTNYHVVQPLLQGKAVHANIRLLFDYMTDTSGFNSSGVSAQLVDDEWLLDQSPYDSTDNVSGSAKLPSSDNLDYALLRIRFNESGVQADNVPRGWFSLTDVPSDWPSGSDAPLLILQHPSGDPLSLAFESNANLQVNANQTRVRYNVNTLGGSSGSPCFTATWQLVALHHAGDPGYQPFAKYNQGIPLRAIVERIVKGNDAAAHAIMIEATG